MRIIKRHVALYVAVVAIIVIGVPYFTGQLVKRKFEDILHVFSELDPVTITLLEYKEGWRHSSAKTRVTFKGRYLQVLLNQDNPLADFSIILDHDIRHGPFVQVQNNNYRDWRFALAMIHSKLFLTEDAKKILAAEVGQPQLLNIDSEITIDGIYHATVQGEPIKVKEASGTEHVVWKGLHGELHLSKDLKHIEAQIMIPGFDFEHNGKHYFAEDIVFKTQRSKNPEGLWLGKMNLNLQNFKFEEKDKQENMRLTGLTIGAITDVQGGMFGSSASMTIEQFNWANNTYGPMNYIFSLKNIAPDVARLFLDNLQQIQLTGEFQPYIHNIIGLLPALLKSRPEFNIDEINIHTAQGDVKGAMNLVIGGINASDLSNISQVIHSINGKADLVIPQAILREILTMQYTKDAKKNNELAKTMNATSQSPTTKVLTDQELADQIAQRVEETMTKQLMSGVLVISDQNYLMTVQLTEGKLSVNGKPMSLLGPQSLPMTGNVQFN